MIFCFKTLFCVIKLFYVNTSLRLSGSSLQHAQFAEWNGNGDRHDLIRMKSRCTSELTPDDPRVNNGPDWNSGHTLWRTDPRSEQCGTIWQNGTANDTINSLYSTHRHTDIKEWDNERRKPQSPVLIITCKTQPSSPIGARYGSVVRAFARGAMGRRIDPSWWTHWAYSRSSQWSTTVVYAILSVGWCI